VTPALTILRGGPGVTVQDQGRFGQIAHGISAGGAADLIALAEGAALLDQDRRFAALEITGLGVRLQAHRPLRIALTGAPLTAACDATPLLWNASHLVPAGSILDLGSAKTGTYGYVSVGGGINTPPLLGSRSTHLTAGLGASLDAGDALPVGPDASDLVGQTLDVTDRFSGGEVRIIPSMQTDLFDAEDLNRLTETDFKRDMRGNRMGVKLTFDGAPFAAQDQRTILSYIIAPGDIQATGDGAPFVLLGECQTTGGYPRLATVIPPDLPIIAQARPGDPIRFRFVTRDDALQALTAYRAHLGALPSSTRPLLRDPADIPDLLSYQLIGGVTAGEDIT